MSAASSITTSTSPRPSSETPASPAPTRVNGVDQKPMEGVSMLYTFDDAEARDPAHQHSLLRADRHPCDLPRRLVGGHPRPGRPGRRGQRNRSTRTSGSSTT